jgi:hypothetical protein
LLTSPFENAFFFGPALLPPGLAGRKFLTNSAETFEASPRASGLYGTIQSACYHSGKTESFFCDRAVSAFFFWSSQIIYVFYVLCF